MSKLNIPIDRRLAGKDKSVGNRERFVRRHKDKVREAVRRAVGTRGIRDVGKEKEEVHIPKKDLNEPTFGHGQGGIRDTVHPGNKDFVRGDRIERPKGGGGQGSGNGEASDSGEGEDDFVFSLSKEEFWEAFFGDLALPNLVRTMLAETPEWKSQRAGYSNEGTPNNIAVVRSLRNAGGRHIAFHRRDNLRLLELLEELYDLESLSWLHPIGYKEIIKEIVAEIAAIEVRLKRDPDKEALRATEDRIKAIKAKMPILPYLDPVDLRYRARIRVPVPTSKAVMFCLMDISGSMDEARKDLSKRFFILLYLFLTRHYEKIDLVFIRHHTQAQEVSEEDFFHAKDTGGTVVSSALVLMEEIIRERYNPSEWNIYGAQASDGDNWHHDSGRCHELLSEQILPRCRYYAYIQVAESEQELWDVYKKLEKEFAHFAMRKALQITEIYPVFRDLFKKQGATA